MPQLHFADARTQQHFEDMSLLHALGWRAAYRDVIPVDYLAREITDRRWVPVFQKNYADGRCHGLVLYQGDIPVCCATYGPARVEAADSGGTICAFSSPDLAQYGELVSLYGHPEHWGQGYGSMVMEEVLRRFQALGCPGCFLYVLRENDRARRFYEKHSFSWDGHSVEIPLTSDIRLTDLRYVRDL